MLDRRLVKLNPGRRFRARNGSLPVGLSTLSRLLTGSHQSLEATLVVVVGCQIGLVGGELIEWTCGHEQQQDEVGPVRLTVLPAPGPAELIYQSGRWRRNRTGGELRLMTSRTIRRNSGDR